MTSVASKASFYKLERGARVRAVTGIKAGFDTPRVKAGTVGRVVARRSSKGTDTRYLGSTGEHGPHHGQYLVKFEGYGADLHCEESELDAA